MPAFSLPAPPRLACAAASRAWERSPTARSARRPHAPAASVVCLSPVTLSALEHLTSELLRTLSRMAASKPTSWLSLHSNIVSHLANTWGPWLAVWAVSLLTLKFIPQQLTPGVHVLVFGVCLKSVTW